MLIAWYLKIIFQNYTNNSFVIRKSAVVPLQSSMEGTMKTNHLH